LRETHWKASRHVTFYKRYHHWRQSSQSFSKMIKKKLSFLMQYMILWWKKNMTYVQPVINKLSGGNKRNDIRTNILWQLSLSHFIPLCCVGFFVLFSYNISCHKNGWSSNMRLKIIMKKVQIFSSILQTTAGLFFELSNVINQMEIRTMYS
jgi:hypothetical protein